MIKVDNRWNNLYSFEYCLLIAQSLHSSSLVILAKILINWACATSRVSTSIFWWNLLTRLHFVLSSLFTPILGPSVLCRLSVSLATFFPLISYAPVPSFFFFVDLLARAYLDQLRFWAFALWITVTFDIIILFAFFFFIWPILQHAEFTFFALSSFLFLLLLAFSFELRILIDRVLFSKYPFIQTVFSSFTPPLLVFRIFYSWPIPYLFWLF